MTPTHSIASVLLTAILAEPGVDLHRLAYADWLEEQGDVERGAFIRVQLELARIGGLHPPANDEDRQIIRRYKMLRQRERHLLTFHSGSWLMFSTQGDWHWRWRRGFVEEISLITVAFLEHARALFSNQPILKVRLTDRKPLAIRGKTGHLLGWVWVRDWAHDGHPWNLSGNLFRCLGGDRDGDMTWHDSEEQAEDALAVAALAHGRNAAGLPPLLTQGTTQ